MLVYISNFVHIRDTFIIILYHDTGQTKFRKLVLLSTKLCSLGWFSVQCFNIPFVGKNLILFLCSISFACAELSEFCIAWQFVLSCSGLRS